MEQLFRGDGFFQQRRHSGGKAGFAGGGVGIGGDDDNRYGRLGELLLPISDPASELDAVDIGHPDIQEDQCEGVLFQGQQGLTAIFRCRHLLPPGGQNILHEPAVEMIILNHQDLT